MNREEIAKEVTAELNGLREHANALNKLCESLALAARGDAAVNAVEGMKEAKESVEKVRKQRIQERLKDA